MGEETAARLKPAAAASAQAGPAPPTSARTAVSSAIASSLPAAPAAREATEFVHPTTAASGASTAEAGAAATAVCKLKRGKLERFYLLRKVLPAAMPARALRQPKAAAAVPTVTRARVAGAAREESTVWPAWAVQAASMLGNWP